MLIPARWSAPSRHACGTERHRLAQAGAFDRELHARSLDDEVTDLIGPLADVVLRRERLEREPHGGRRWIAAGAGAADRGEPDLVMRVGAGEARAVRACR